MRKILLFISLLPVGAIFNAFVQSKVSIITTSNDIPTLEVPVDSIFLIPPLIPVFKITTKEESYLDKVENFFTGGSSYENAREFGKAAQFEDGFIRMVRLAIAPLNDGSLNLGQVCDVFDYLDKNRRYINDPIGREYFAKPSEYWEDHIGDCDDQAICAATALGGIGCFSRIVLAGGLNTGHAYAEIYLGTKEELMQSYITYLHSRYPESRGNIILFKDSKGYWLNIEIGASYPGSLAFSGQRLFLYYPLYDHWFDCRK